jgi:rubredoxin
MLAAMEGPTVAERPATHRALRCLGCGHYFGRIVGRVLHEEGGNKSSLPVIRKCPVCGKRNVKI